MKPAVFNESKYTKWYYDIIDSAKTRNMISGYCETHHIVPRCLGGSDDTSNLVTLTAREHFVCHRLLIKMVTGKMIHQMVKAASMMTIVNQHQDRYHVNSRLFEALRVAAAEAHSKLTKGKPKHTAESKKKLAEYARNRIPYALGKPKSAEHKTALSKANKGKRIAPETIAKIVKANTGKKRSYAQRQRISQGLIASTVVRKPVSDATKLKISLASKGKSKPFKGRIAPNTGVAHSAESIQKMRDSHANREIIECLHCHKVVPKPNFSRWHGDNCKHRPS